MARTTLPLTEPLHRYRARGHGRARPVHPNTATAVLMAPLALADELQACSYPFAMTFALAASSAFMTPCRRQ